LREMVKKRRCSSCGVSEKIDPTTGYSNMAQHLGDYCAECVARALERIRREESGD
jgi:hypothetical protein